MVCQTQPNQEKNDNTLTFGSVMSIFCAVVFLFILFIDSIRTSGSGYKNKRLNDYMYQEFLMKNTATLSVSGKPLDVMSRERFTSSPIIVTLSMNGNTKTVVLKWSGKWKDLTNGIQAKVNWDNILYIRQLKTGYELSIIEEKEAFIFIS